MPYYTRMLYYVYNAIISCSANYGILRLVLTEPRIVLTNNTRSLRHKNYVSLVNKSSLSVLNEICAADSESDVGFALLRRNLEFFEFLTHA